MKQNQKITKDMVISDILVQNSEKAPILAEIMIDYGIHCIGCGAASFETLEQGVLSHGFSEDELEKLVESLNNAVKDSKKFEKDIEDFTLNLTESAVYKIKELMKKEKKENYLLRISVVGGGCSGFMYDMEITNKHAPSDFRMEYKGINIAIDKNSLEYLSGAEIDFIDTLNETGFKFNNPNAQKSCGCGKSFR